MTRIASSQLAELCRTGIPGYDPRATCGDSRFDAQAAQYAIDFIESCCTHVKGELAGKPLNLQPWEKAIIGNTFGWKRPDGTRRYREVLVFVPRKNGKTTLVAALVLLVEFTDHEPGAEIYSAASDRDQATLVFEQARVMVLNEPELKSRAKILETSKTITFEAENTKYKAISAEAASKHGYNSHLVVVDELHAQPDRKLVDVLKTSQGTRRQPLMIYITTSDYERVSICNETYDYAMKVRDGIFDDPAFLPVIYEASRTDDWKDPAVWRKANPNLGVSITEEYLARECQRAQQSPAYENTFKLLHLNIRTEQAERWLSMDRWDSLADPVDAEALRGRPCYAGMDLASKIDMTAVCLVFPPFDGDPLWRLMPFYFVPANIAKQRERRNREQYLGWIRDGHIIATEGDITDYSAVRLKLRELGGLYDLREIGFDPWNATQIATQLGEEDGFNMVLFRQGYGSLSEPTKELEALVVAGKLAHGGHPVLRWNASNVSITKDPPGNIKPAKDVSSGKIDGIVAAIIGIGRAMLMVKTPGSVYETRGVLVL